ncbi:MAG TPA: hypothetical protein VNZ45_18010, partial [Bacteroidia bacterium]|nr:hypothetical protein [Bacteroidia bacterium]
MNKKITIAYCSVLLFILFAGCKKNDTLTPNIKNIHLIVLEPSPIDSSAVNRTYKLRGTIVSPARIDMKDYGFFVKSSSSVPTVVSLGSATKAGYVEHDYQSTSLLLDSMIVMYAILQTGDTLYSTTTSSQSLTTANPSSFQIINFNITPNPSVDLYCNSDFIYNPTSGYTVTTYELLYKNSTATTFNSLPLTFQPGLYTVSSLSLVSAVGLLKGTSYDFQLHIVLTPPSGNTA